MTQLEVELKFKLNDVGAMRAALTALRCAWAGTSIQTDTYFAHPARDFRATDEALRLRRSDDESFITYKGPRLDTQTKTRREIELPLVAGDDTVVRFGELLLQLGFSPVGEVRKERESGSVVWQEHEVTVALDHVDQLGWFVELELLASPAELNDARALLLSLAERLGLASPERRGYLHLLLELASSAAHRPS